MRYTKPKTRRCRSGNCTNAALPVMWECAACRRASVRQRQADIEASRELAPVDARRGIAIVTPHLAVTTTEGQTHCGGV